MTKPEPPPRFFKSQSAFAKWLHSNHDKATELWVGFHKKSSGKPSITYQEALDEALCVGWIDGIRKNVDDTGYKIRFTPRRRRSIWSGVNIKRVGWLSERQLMKPSGMAAFEAREAARSGVYSYENQPRELDAEYEMRFRKNRMAWDFYDSQPPSYKKITRFWVMSARLEETRLRRLAALIAASAKRVRVQ